uniref:Ornithine decarboxylase n=1 Tax=Panagrolaimus sp. ES5 TaxID=591445 RepID=A0AC34F7L3_9BILA
MAHYFEIIGNSKIAVFKTAIDNEIVAKTIASFKDAILNDEPFLVVNLTTLVTKFQQWQKELPRVKPFYAVKCNDDPVILKTLAELGTGFDCASKGEINKVLGELQLTSAENIVYANPCKTRGFIAHAQTMGVYRMTFDNEEELAKVKKIHSCPQMILRIAVSDPSAQCQLGIKFGCDPETDGPKLLQKAADLNIPVIGVSFHVGSDLFDFGIKVGHSMTLLDIGGGYPGIDTEEISLAKIAAVINPALAEHFPISGNYEIIAEPGRFFACAPISVTANIISSVKVSANRITNNDADSNKDGFMYYMNDGVYGSFNCKLFDHYSPIGKPLYCDKNDAIQHFPCTIWGPTCDGLDQVEISTSMRQMNVGEWLYYPFMGAYTCVSSSNFNGFEKPKLYYFIDEKSL